MLKELVCRLWGAIWYCLTRSVGNIIVFHPTSGLINATIKKPCLFLYKEMCRRLSAKNTVLIGKAKKQLIVSPSLGRMKNWCPGHSHNSTFHPQEMGTVNTRQYKMVSKAVLSKNTSCQLRSRSETICKLVMISM